MINSQDSHAITELIQSLPLPEIEKRTPLQISMLVLLEAMNRRMDFIEADANGWTKEHDKRAAKVELLLNRLVELMEQLQHRAAREAREKAVAK